MKLSCGISVETQGNLDHPALVFLHGVGTDGTAWQPQLRAFADEFRVIAWHMPGYADSDPHTPLTFPDLATGLGNVLDNLEIEAAHIIGHSIGGMVAQQFAASFPQRVHSLTLSATSPAFGKPDGEWQQEFVRKRLEPLEAGKTLADLAPKMVQELTGDTPDPVGISLALHSIQAVSNAAFAAGVRCIVGFDRRDNLPNLTMPVLVLSGAQDSNAPAAMMEKMASKIPDARYVCLDGVGHLGNLENPNAFNQTLRDFFATLKS